MSDHDVSEMLRRRAADVRVSPDGLDRIQEKLATAPSTATGGRRLATVAVAAAVLVVAVATVAMFGRDDDDPTSVEVGPAAPAGAPAELLEAVWPTANAEELRAMDADYLHQPEPFAAASAYLRERTGRTLAEDGFTLVAGDTDDAVLRTGDGRVDAEITMKRLDSADDPSWYVVGTTSEALLEGDTSYVGEHLTGEVLVQHAGDQLDVAIGAADHTTNIASYANDGAVGVGDTVPFDERVPDSVPVVVQAHMIRP